MLVGCSCSADDVAITREEEAGDAMDVDFHVMAADGSDTVVPGDVVDVVLEESSDEISDAIGGRTV